MFVTATVGFPVFSGLGFAIASFSPPLCLLLFFSPFPPPYFPSTALRTLSSAFVIKYVFSENKLIPYEGQSPSETIRPSRRSYIWMQSAILEWCWIKHSSVIQTNYVSFTCIFSSFLSCTAGCWLVCLSSRTLFYIWFSFLFFCFVFVRMDNDE